MSPISKYLAITIITVVAMTLVFATFIVAFTGSTDGLVAIGQMVSLIVEAFLP